MATMNLGLDSNPYDGDAWKMDNSYQSLSGNVNSFLPGKGYLSSFQNGQGAAWDGGIKQWFMDNQGATDQAIHKAMDQYGVSPIDVARATGADLNETNYRYLHSGETPAQTTQPTQPTQPTQATPQFAANNAGISSPTMDSYQKNPYLDQMAQGITDQMNQNWERNVNPSLRSGAMAAGGFGGSRQGVVEANALNDMNRSLGQNLTNLYGTDYTQDRQRALQKYSADQGYNLGMANNNLGYANLDANIYNSNFNNQLNSAQFGLNAYNTMMNYNQTGVNNATQIQNTPLQYQQYFNGQYNAGGGKGGTTTQTTGTTSNPWMTGATAVKALGY